jgi:hypothetical protein
VAGTPTGGEPAQKTGLTVDVIPATDIVCVPRSSTSRRAFGRPASDREVKPGPHIADRAAGVYQAGGRVPVWSIAGQQHWRPGPPHQRAGRPRLSRPRRSCRSQPSTPDRRNRTTTGHTVPDRCVRFGQPTAISSRPSARSNASPPSRQPCDPDGRYVLPPRRAHGAPSSSSGFHGWEPFWLHESACKGRLAHAGTLSPPQRLAECRQPRAPEQASSTPHYSALWLGDRSFVSPADD